MYVQHQLREHSSLVSDLLKQNAMFYVCGNAVNMVREVRFVLARLSPGPNLGHFTA